MSSKWKMGRKPVSTTEQKRWEELNKIRRLPVSIAEKRILKAQLTNLPVVKAKGRKLCLWNFRRFKEEVVRRWKRQIGKRVAWQRSLQEIEVRGGTSIVNVFLFIKWTVYFNILLSVIILSFIILPYMLTEKIEPNPADTCPANFTSPKTAGEIVTNQSLLPMRQLSQCCVETYFESYGQKVNSEHWKSFSSIELSQVTTKRFGITPLTYGFYAQYDLKLSPGASYNFQKAYLLVPVGLFLLSLMTMVWQIGVGIKEMTLSKEGEFYKFSNLVFAGWDHYTNDKKGAEFKKKILLNEMKIALRAEKLKIRKLSKKQKFRLLVRRILANVLVVFTMSIIASCIYFAADYSIRKSCIQSACEAEEFKNRSVFVQYFIKIIPALVIVAANFIFPVFLKRVIRKMERYSHEVQTTLTLIRALLVRVLAIAFAAVRYYLEEYCEKAPNTCIICEHERFDSGLLRDKDACWESLFGDHIYLIIVVDLAFKVVLVFVFGYGKLLLGKLTKLKFLLSVTKFNIIRHSLDVIYIQSLAWFFYFAPFLPIVVAFDCLLMAYMKKFNLMVLSQAAPDTFRTTRTTTIYVTTKLFAFVAVSLAIGFVLTTLEPSRSCGPFRGLSVPWDAIALNQSDFGAKITPLLGSPGIAIPIVVITLTMSYFYYSTAQAHRRMVETLRHILILEGHDKQYLFERLNLLRDEAAALLLADQSATEVETAPAPVLNTDVPVVSTKAYGFGETQDETPRQS